MKIHIIFKSQDDPAGGPQQQVFVEVHNEDGKSINAGVWSADGEYEQLTIDLIPLAIRLNDGKITLHKSAMLPNSKTARRNAKIYDQRQMGMTVAGLALQHGLSVSTVDQIIARERTRRG